MSRAHGQVISGRRGELRYHGHVVAVLDRWTRRSCRRDAKVGTTVADLTFTVGQVNQFWLNFAKAPTHVALPISAGGVRRVYDLIESNLDAGRARFRTPHVALD